MLSVNHLCVCLELCICPFIFVVMLSLHQHQFLSEALQWRAQTDPDHILYVLLNAKVGLPRNHTHFNEVDLINSSNSNVLEK